MQFTCQKQDLCSGIAHVLRAVSAKSTIPALEGICVQLSEGEVVLTGYDLEIGIRTRIPAQCTDSSTCVMNARLFSEMTKRMPGDEIRFEMDENWNVRLSSADTEYRMSAMSAEEYPDLPVVESGPSTGIPQPLLRSMILQSSFAASTKEDKPILTGELFEAGDGMLYIVAMDRYRLALRQEPAADLGSFHFVVPKKALTELIGLMRDDAEEPCAFSTNGTHIVFSVGGCELFARLLKGEFHNFRSSIPSDAKTTVTLNTRDMLGLAERCSLLINEKNKAPMRCVFGDGAMEISCKTGIGDIHDRIPADIDGESLTIGFSNKYLLEALRACECDKIRLHMSGSNKVIKITPPAGESFVYLIMPIQLKN
ncbi:MAG: DNA polymerase III subunit beta [Oscillospiraceae bacterium]|nr:DNA polymerase III subunit beta [Oscillospiraceae bacterium]